MDIAEIGGWTGLVGGIAGVAAILLQWHERRARKAESRLILEAEQLRYGSEPVGLSIFYVTLKNVRKTSATWESLRVVRPSISIQMCRGGTPPWKFSDPTDRLLPDHGLKPSEEHRYLVGVNVPKSCKVVIFEAVSIDRETGRKLRSRGRIVVEQPFLTPPPQADRPWNGPGASVPYRP